MRENKGFINACCLLWGSLLVMVCIRDSDIGFLLGIVVIPISIISWLVLSGIAAYKVIVNNYLPWKKRVVPLYFSVAPLFALFLIGGIVSELQKENTWLTITNADFHGSNNFQFMKNGEYSSWRDSPLGRSAEESGHYERQDSVLTLHPEPKDGKAQEFQLAIRPYSEFQRQQSSSHITLVTLNPN